MKYQWLLFDADGTLFDYDRAEEMALKKALGTFGIPFQDDYVQKYRQINGQIWREFERGEVTQIDLRTNRFALLSQAIEAEFDPLLFSRAYLKFLGEEHYLMDGAQEILAALAEKVGLMLITNGLKDVQRSRLDRSTIKQYFTDVIISEEVGVAKPDARIFEVAFQRMGNPDKREVLMIGDSLTSDIRGGNQFGIDTCWFNPQHELPHQGVEMRYQITHLSELLPIIGLNSGIKGDGDNPAQSPIR